MSLLKKIGVFICAIAFFLVPSKAYAADVKTDYQVQYVLNDSQGSLKTHVFFKIAITNLSSEVYVKTFSVAFPSSFLIQNIEAADDKGSIQPVVTTTDAQNKLDLTFNDPNVGKGSVNTFFINFDQEKLFMENGSIWEVILPTIQTPKDNASTYKIIVNLPEGTSKKISIAKPKPDAISGDQIVWDNPPTKTIYAIFGDTQYYQTTLNYHIQNPKLTPVYTDVAFPPQTPYQNVFVDSIKPLPDSVYIDEDGNYIGRYYLNPRETKPIQFMGTIVEHTKPNDDLIQAQRTTFTRQQKYLLNQSKYWTLNKAQLNSIESLKSPSDIYEYTLHNLSYNYASLNGSTKRLGAQSALQNPQMAVCVEFSDVFTAIAREKGIYTREIEGYGYTNDSRLRPISLLADVLHSWPEYYDQISKRWIAVDPTWENTSGIDYYSSLDLNHITFAIHGKDPEYPLPAGMYKIDDSQDVFIKPIKEAPQEKQSIVIDDEHFPQKLVSKKTYYWSVHVINKGNSFLHNVPVTVDSADVSISPSKTIIETLAPYQDVAIKYTLKVKNDKTKASDILLSVNKNTAKTERVAISSYDQDLVLKIFMVALVATGLVVLLKLSTRKKRSNEYENTDIPFQN